jgi:hypothetical protein
MKSTVAVRPVTGLLLAATLVALLTATAAVASSVEPLEAHDCVKRGYDPAALSCRTCNAVDAAFSGAGEDTDDGALAKQMRWECRQCCNKELGSSDEEAEDGIVRKIAKVVIEHDGRWFEGSPLASFERKHLNDFDGKVTLRHKSGSPPRALLFTAENKKPVETVNLQGWEAGLVNEFLLKKLPATSGNDGDESEEL